MFAGIVEESARVSAVEHRGVSVGSRLTIESKLDHSATICGDSTALDGCCLTVVNIQRNAGATHLSFDAAPETLRKTTLGSLKVGSRVNLERSLPAGARIHGHFVSGHVDANIALRQRSPDGNAIRLEWELPKALAAFVAPKGSISLAGVSLTVGEVSSDSFSVYIIPHTAEVTTLGDKKPGDSVNVEIDMLARYVRNILLHDPEATTLATAPVTARR